jgi:DNA polymerase
MLKMSKPRKPRKAEREAGVTGLLWWDTPELRATLYAYCRQDVLAEEGLSSALDDLNTQETSVYLLDQVINERGFQLDRPAVDAALALISKETKALNAELSTLTGGTVTKATQRAKMLGWFEDNGLELDDTQKETIDGLDHTKLQPHVSRAVSILRALGRSSTAKYQRMDDWMCPDARVRGGLLYHGAGTGRWSGAGVQPHNFPKGTVKDQEALWKTLKGQDRTQIGHEYSGVMEALSNGLRGTIIASEGKDLYVADYASIEARVVMWLAEEQEALDFFRTGGDIYLDMAAEIYNKECYNPSPERQVGKFAILGLGFQMGAPKFQGTCEKFGVKIEDEFAVRVVEAYRGKYWRVKQMWTDQEDAALQAVRTKRPVQCGYVTWLREGHFLFCELPSGRRLAYPYPEIRARETPWGAVKASLTFMGVDPYTRKWKRQVTYGGSLVENITQAVARDIMAEAMLRCEALGYEVALTVHDEIVTENAQGNVADFVQILTTVPEWAVGLPVEAAGFVAKRYKK